MKMHTRWQEMTELQKNLTEFGFRRREGQYRVLRLHFTENTTYHETFAWDDEGFMWYAPLGTAVPAGLTKAS